MNAIALPLWLSLLGSIGHAAYGQDRQSVAPVEALAVGASAAYQSALVRPDAAIAKSLVHKQVLSGGGGNTGQFQTPLGASLARHETARQHVRNAANLLARLDTLPGSYGRSAMQGGFVSLGDGARRGNPMFKQVLAELTKAKHLGISHDNALTSIYCEGGRQIPQRLLQERQASLLNNLKAVEKLGLDDPKNLGLLQQGRAPVVTRGNPRYVGKIAEVDHRVARAVAPRFENEVANLQLLPEAINGRKLATHGAIEQEHFRRLQRAYGRPIIANRVVVSGVTTVLIVTPVEMLLQGLTGGSVDWSRVASMSGLAGASAGAGSFAGNWTTYGLMETRIGGSASVAAAEMLGLRSASRFANITGGGIGGGVAAIVFAYGGKMLGYYDLSTANRLSIAGVVGAGAAVAAKSLTTLLVATYATASTGTAISSLGGASATSASLAWLGGGSLASGGFGAASGAVLLSGGVLVVAVGVSAAVMYGFQVYDEHQEAIRLGLTLDYLANKQTFSAPESNTGY